MMNFYRNIKRFYLVVAIILFVLLVPATIQNFMVKDWVAALLTLLALIFMIGIALGILIYYKNIVIEVSFEKDNTIIKTNSKEYILSTKNFIEVNDSKSFGRIFIKYLDKGVIMKFTFQKRYSPFKEYTLNIDEMKKHMVFATFKRS